MLLFPGEETYYKDRDGWMLRDTPQGTLILCNGRCDRADRPLGCRIFPLLPLVRDDAVKIAVDARARSVCPLCDAGVRGLCSAFADAVRQCGELLLQDPDQRSFLIRLTQIHDELRDMQKRFGGR